MIEQLEKIYDEDTIYYCNEKMLNDGILIEQNILETDDTDIELWLTVEYINKAAGIGLEYASFTLYLDDLPAPIQIYRMIKDVYDLYNNNNVYGFIEIIDKLSVQKISSSMQSNENNAEEIKNRIQHTFDYVERMMG